MFLVGLILLAALGFAAGFIVSALIFVKEPDGTMYFLTDTDGKEYISARFDAKDISQIDSKKNLTLKCVKLPSDFSQLAPQQPQPQSSQQNQ